MDSVAKRACDADERENEPEDRDIIAFFYLNPRKRGVKSLAILFFLISRDVISTGISFYQFSFVGGKKNSAEKNISAQ